MGSGAVPEVMQAEGSGAVPEVGGGWWARCLAADSLLWLSFKMPDRCQPHSQPPVQMDIRIFG